MASDRKVGNIRVVKHSDLDRFAYTLYEEICFLQGRKCSIRIPLRVNASLSGGMYSGEPETRTYILSLCFKGEKGSLYSLSYPVIEDKEVSREVLTKNHLEILALKVREMGNGFDCTFNSNFLLFKVTPKSDEVVSIDEGKPLFEAIHRVVDSV